MTTFTLALIIYLTLGLFIAIVAYAPNRQAMERHCQLHWTRKHTLEELDRATRLYTGIVIIAWVPLIAYVLIALHLGKV